MDKTGDYAHIVKASIAARALYPLTAKNMSRAEIKECLKDLFDALGFDEFRPERNLLSDLDGELEEYMALLHSTPDTFWSTVEGAEEYDKHLEELARKEPDKYNDRSWKDDRIECARRAWEWWRTHHKKFNYFSKTAALVALVPITSAAVERIFSQVKFIIETVGENGLEETLAVRLMERVNVYD